MLTYTHARAHRKEMKITYPYDNQYTLTVAMRPMVIGFKNFYNHRYKA